MLFILSIVLVVITVVFFLLYLFFKNKSDRLRKPCLYVPQGGKEVPVYFEEPHSKLYLAILIILLVFFAPLILYLAFRLNNAETAASTAPTPTPLEAVALTSSPESTASPSPEMSPPPDGELFVWFDNLTPYTEYKSNFSIGSWSDQSSFLVGERSYTHGIGMQICGAAQEQLVSEDETTDGVITHNCKKASISYALRGRYSKLVFSIGVDSNIESEYGPKEKNGEGRIVLTDTSRNGRSSLFDTGWQDYSYEHYEIEVPLKDVEFLEITIMSKDFQKSGAKRGLRFAIVDPILFINNVNQS